MPHFRTRLLCFAFSFGLAVGFAGSGSAQTDEGAAPSDASIAGRVVDPTGAPVAGATARLSGTTRSTTTDAEGRFLLPALRPGRYLVEVSSDRFGRGVATAETAAGETREVEIEIDFDVHAESVTVTASPDPAAADELARPVAVLEGIELLAAIEPSLGETLAREPGVSSNYFGPGASRPIIRGLGGDRIRVLDNGLGAGDVSSTSADHAVAVEPLSAERVEIVRGPATLLHGSSAVGGVVNVIDGSIPDLLPEAAISGTLTLRGASAAEERAGALELTGAAGRFAWHLSGSKRESDDVEIPGFAESRAMRDAEEEEPTGEAEHEDKPEAFGILPNSATKADSLRAGLSYVGDGGFFGVGVSGFETRYGVPGHAHHSGHEAGGESSPEEEQDEEPAVRIDLEQRRVDLRGGLERSFGIFRGLRVRAGTYDYEHRELEGSEVGTLFLTEGWEGRLEAPHRAFGPLTGTWGAQLSRRDFEAIGEEAFVPANDSDLMALFAYEEITAGPLTFQLGARWESQDLSTVAPDLPDRSFSGLSGSAGLIGRLSESTRLSFVLSRSVTIPNPEALYADGPHVASRAHEIGDPRLDEEVSLGADAGLHVEGGRLHADLSLFYNRVDDFVTGVFTGEEIDGLPVLRYGATDARLYGGELDVHVPLVHEHPHHLEIDLLADFVRGDDRSSGEPLPRIPPPRFGGGLSYRGEAWSASAAVSRVTAADRLAPFELATGAWTMLDAVIGYRFFLGGAVHDLLLSGKNLTDEEARVHASFLKDLAPLPGRDVRLSYRLAF